MIQAVIIHLGWSFLSGFFFFFYVAITHTNIWSTCWTIQNNGNQQQTGRFPWSPATPGFVSFCFQVRWQRGFICPNGLDCNTSSDIIFVIFAACLSVPLWLLKTQDISVPVGAQGMAEPGLRVSALNKLSGVFSAAPAGHCYPTFRRFSHGDAVPHCVRAGWLWGRQGAQPRQWQLLSICRQQLCVSCAQRHCSF